MQHPLLPLPCRQSPIHYCLTSNCLPSPSYTDWSSTSPFTQASPLLPLHRWSHSHPWHTNSASPFPPPMWAPPPTSLTAKWMIPSPPLPCEQCKPSFLSPLSDITTWETNSLGLLPGYSTPKDPNYCPSCWSNGNSGSQVGAQELCVNCLWAKCRCQATALNLAPWSDSMAIHLSLPFHGQLPRRVKDFLYISKTNYPRNFFKRN